MGTIPNSQLFEKESVTDDDAILDSLICQRVDILNNTGKIINVTQYDNGVAGATYPCPDKSFYSVQGILNADQVHVSNGSDATAITVQYRAYA